jgi:hypothetical protein
MYRLMRSIIEMVNQNVYDFCTGIKHKGNIGIIYYPAIYTRFFFAICQINLILPIKQNLNKIMASMFVTIIVMHTLVFGKPRR